MWWWVGAIALGLFQLGWIIAVLAGVFRRKEKAWSLGTIMGYLVHGTFAVLALWMLMNAIA